MHGLIEVPKAEKWVMLGVGGGFLALGVVLFLLSHNLGVLIVLLVPATVFIGLAWNIWSQNRYWRKHIR